MAISLIPLPSCAVVYVSHSICKQEETFVAIRAQIQTGNTTAFVGTIPPLHPLYDTAQTGRTDRYHCYILLPFYPFIFGQSSV